MSSAVLLRSGWKPGPLRLRIAAQVLHCWESGTPLQSAKESALPTYTLQLRQASIGRRREDQTLRASPKFPAGPQLPGQFAWWSLWWFSYLWVRVLLSSGGRHDCLRQIAPHCTQHCWRAGQSSCQDAGEIQSTGTALVTASVPSYCWTAGRVASQPSIPALPPHWRRQDELRSNARAPHRRDAHLPCLLLCAGCFSRTSGAAPSDGWVALPPAGGAATTWPARESSCHRSLDLFDGLTSASGLSTGQHSFSLIAQLSSVLGLQSHCWICAEIKHEVVDGSSSGHPVGADN